MAKILITGATGFIGYHLAQALRAGNHEVTCMARKSSRYDRVRSLGRFVHGDITDYDSLAAAIHGHDAVFHLAGCLHALRVEELYRVNEQGTRNVARACAEQLTPPRLTIVSSLAAMGPSSNVRPRQEIDPPAPVSYYGKSKQAGERAAREWADRVPITIVRPPMVFGEADPATREIFGPIARQSIHVVPTWRDHYFSLIHADDLVQLLIRAWNFGKRLLRFPGDSVDAAVGCYFAACEKDVAYADWGRMIGQAMGHPRTIVIRLGPIAIWAMAGLATLAARLRGRSWYFNIDKAREARAGSWTCSPDVAKQELGFEVAAPLPERIRQTALWYRQEGWI